ncbi:NIPSNAP family containing protein [Streptosporangium subroseum]|uniref:NIPSNAP family containing protein n=1 Tax=Streptosporangium subroseum TaxID=106412 RepID=UPI00343CDEF8
MTTQLWICNVKPGWLDAWVAAWRSLTVPLRLRFDFEIPESCVDVGCGEHIWVIFYAGRGSFDEANTAYRRSSERVAMGLAPGEHLLDEEIRAVDPVL